MQKSNPGTHVYGRVRTTSNEQEYRPPLTRPLRLGAPSGGLQPSRPPQPRRPTKEAVYRFARKTPPQIEVDTAAKSAFPIPPAFHLSWSHYVRLLSGLRGSPVLRDGGSSGWLVGASTGSTDCDSHLPALYSRQLPAELSPSVKTADTEIKDPFVLEFLGLKDEYSESELEDALIRELEQFLLELGNDFAFVARQKRLRVGTEWYRVDLLFFHRRLRSLIVVELKLGKFTHADAGQMNLYLNYAREHWINAEENPPIGLILCSEHDAVVAHYALGNLANRVLAREYQLTLPQEQHLIQRLEERRRHLESRGAVAKQLPG